MPASSTLERVPSIRHALAVEAVSSNSVVTIPRQAVSQANVASKFCRCRNLVCNLGRWEGEDPMKIQIMFAEIADHYHRNPKPCRLQIAIKQHLPRRSLNHPTGKPRPSRTTRYRRPWSNARHRRFPYPIVLRFGGKPFQISSTYPCIKRRQATRFSANSPRITLAPFCSASAEPLLSDTCDHQS